MSLTPNPIDYKALSIAGHVRLHVEFLIHSFFLDPLRPRPRVSCEADSLRYFHRWEISAFEGHALKLSRAMKCLYWLSPKKFMKAFWLPRSQQFCSMILLSKPTRRSMWVLYRGRQSGPTHAQHSSPPPCACQPISSITLSFLHIQKSPSAELASQINICRSFVVAERSILVSINVLCP